MKEGNGEKKALSLGGLRKGVLITQWQDGGEDLIWTRLSSGGELDLDFTVVCVVLVCDFAAVSVSCGNYESY